ncbi:hypothetical protein HPB51_028100 [Rhipicephalus microplus]|uniref:Uncharacterized protein n=1 Tax=Rhipicephalus microplus TaxID=6941 RepID=A0A9J6CY25_RHIMP|nr:hypothetical protein HPB51_028100 [Rhipicephalus microplus]
MPENSNDFEVKHLYSVYLEGDSRTAGAYYDAEILHMTAWKEKMDDYLKEVRSRHINKGATAAPTNHDDDKGGILQRFQGKYCVQRLHLQKLSRLSIKGHIHHLQRDSSEETLRELVRSIVKEELRNILQPQVMMTVSSLTSVIHDEVRHAILQQEPEMQPLRLQQPLQERRVSTYADALR